jgi:hypothetical protein
MSYDAHDKIRRFLMRKWRTQVKADHLTGLCLADIEMCDAAIWHRMAEIAESYDGIQPDEAGLPLDWIVEDVLAEPEILLLVGPRMRGTGGGGGRAPPKPRNPPKKTGDSAAAKKAKRVKKKANQKVRNTESAAYRESLGIQPGGKGKGGKGGKAGKPAQLALPPPGGKGDRRSNCPLPLVGMNRLCKDGFSGKCYAFNLNDFSKASDQCKGTQPGQKCDRGYHLCMNPGCEDQAHALKLQHGSG